MILPHNIRSFSSLAFGVLTLAWGTSVMRAQDAVPENVPVMREWTNLQGKTMTAAYLGHKGDDVAFQMKDGKLFFLPSIKLSPQDLAYLQEHQIPYMTAWKGWPREASASLSQVAVKEEGADSGKFYYTTANFRFECDVNLGGFLMKDLARVFELTHQLHTHSPFGILAEPENDFFQAHLISTHEAYMRQGGMKNSAGVYKPKEKIFLAPLDLMGVKQGSAGWRKDSNNYDVSTIVHELTHMLTHDMLEGLPIWLNEGYAEYISNIPIRAQAFQTDPKSIREGVRDLFFRDHLAASGSNNKSRNYSTEEKENYFQSSEFPALISVREVLTMTDQKWASNDGMPYRYGYSRMIRLYRTSHLIFYYFMQIEGEKGVAKIRKFFEKNKKFLREFEKYQEDFKQYRLAMDAFFQLPGVVKLPDGRFEYPSELKPPVAPEPPLTSPEEITLSGLDELLAGESAEVVGAKIEKALIENLGIRFTFK